MIKKSSRRKIVQKKKGENGEWKGQGGGGKITKPRQETRRARMERIRESQDALRSAFGLIFRGHKT